MTATEQAITEATRYSMARGRKVLQIFLAGDEATHVREMLAMMRPAHGASVLDAGCGIGEVARLMSDERPDLKFILLNNHGWQLEHCRDFNSVLADMHETGLPGASFDGVMVNYAIGYADKSRFLQEVRRLLKGDGFLFICDMIGDSPILAELGYGDNEDLVRLALEYGFRLQEEWRPSWTLDSTRAAIQWEQAGDFANCVRPAVWRFIKV